MTKPILIEIAGEPLGVVVPTDGRFRFLAIKLEAFDFDGRIYNTVADARRDLSSTASRRDTALAS